MIRYHQIINGDVMKYYAYYFWIFFVGSIMGVVIESIWCVLKYKKLESRKGLVYGPFNPLYGVASMILSFCINNFSDKSLGEIFLIGVVIGSILEYLCSYFQEKIMGTVSWDYRDFKLNIKGRITFLYSIFWGILTVLWGEWFMPTINNYVPLLVDYIFLTIVVSILMFVDCVVSLYAGIRRNQRRNHIKATTDLQRHFDEKYNDEVMDEIYPNSKFTDD